MINFSHFSVMLNECIEGLAIDPNGIYVDGTAGGAGHSTQIAKRLSGGKLIALDKDPTAVAIATERLSGLSAQVVQSDFKNVLAVLEELGIDKINGALLDLGVSSHQLDEASRGFSYHREAPLDMRMAQSGLSAWDVVNTYPQNEIKRILYVYGEEKFAPQIAAKICKEREVSPIQTTTQLADIIASALPPAVRRKQKHPARQTFQAIRMEVNGELTSLEQGIDDFFEALAPGGRLCIITFHSLEDRMVKHKFLDYCTGCTCPPDFPVCVCGKTPRAKLICKKPILPSKEELEVNSRSRSAKLRILEKIK